LGACWSNPHLREWHRRIDVFSLEAWLSKKDPGCSKKAAWLPGRGIGSAEIRGVVKDVIHGR